MAGHDRSATQPARGLLLADADADGSWLARASKGRIRASDAAAGVRMHVEELMAQADASAARDYARAYQIERAAYEHMFTAGAGLAKASVTLRWPSAWTPRRSSSGRPLPCCWANTWS